MKRKRQRLAFTLPERSADPARVATVTKIEAAWEAAQEITAQASGDELLIYGSIGISWYDEGITGKSVRKWLDERRGKDVSVRINSPGGDVFEGVAIHNALAQHDGKVTIHVDALAASASSIIAMGGDEIHMSANSLMMLHRAWTYTAGNAGQLEKEAELLRKIDDTLVATYVARSGQAQEDVEAMLDAETWFTAEEAKAKGFADEITPAKTPEPDADDVTARAAKFAALRTRAAALLESNPKRKP